MTMLPKPSGRKLGLVIDLDTCVGCQACAVACKSWNTAGAALPLSDQKPYGAEPSGTWLNRVHSYEVTPDPARCDRPDAPSQIVHFPRSCLHCEEAPCVTVCPTGASIKRAEDGIVLVEEDKCMGCGLCAWACPYGAREMDAAAGVMKKCTLCVDRLDDASLPAEERVPACVRACPTQARHFGDLGDPDSAASRLVAERGGVALMAGLGAKPVNRYLPPRPKADIDGPAARAAALEDAAPGGFLGWLDRALDRIA